MSLIPEPAPAELSSQWSRFRDVTGRLATTRFADGLDTDDDEGFEDDELAVFGEFLLARDALFEDLALPVTAHNSLRLYDCASEGGSLEHFLADVDVPFPSAVRNDEGLFLSAFAVYCGWREVDDDEGRVYDAEAFLGVPHHPHNAAVVESWLAGELGWFALHAQLSRDDAFLDVAVA